jgi:hypothetical protein
MLRDDNMTAVLISKGVLKLNHDTPCACGAPLLAPMAFNAVSRVDGKHVCERCEAWEIINGAKTPA